MDCLERTSGGASLLTIGITIAIVVASIVALSCQFAAVILLWGVVAVTGARFLADWFRRHSLGSTADEFDDLLRRPHL